MKKVMIAIHALTHGGAENVAAKWANYLVQNGYKVAFLVRYRTEKEQIVNKNIEVFPMAETVEIYGALPIFQRFLMLRKIVKQFAPDVMISMLPRMQIMVMLATWGMKFKRYETIRNNPWLDKDIGKQRFLWNLCFEKSDRIIIQTQEQAEYFSETLQKKCVVISNPIQQAPPMKQYQEGFPRKFVAVGRVSEQKNYPLMIKAFAEVSRKIEDCTLDIYGAGAKAYVARIHKQINDEGLQNRVRLLGWSGNISNVLPAYDAYLMSSDYEGMPNALAEAMAAGLVCLSTDCKTGPKDMIDHEKNGFLAKTGDVCSFAEGINTIAEMDLQRCVEVGSGARKKIFEMCSEQNTLMRLVHLIESKM